VLAVLPILFLAGALPACLLVRNHLGRIAGILFGAGVIVTAVCFLAAFSGGQLSGGQIEAAIGGVAAASLTLGVGLGSLVGSAFRKREVYWDDEQDVRR